MANLPFWNTMYSSNYEDDFSYDRVPVAPPEPVTPQVRNRQNLEAMRTEQLKREYRKAR